MHDNLVKKKSRHKKLFRIASYIIISSFLIMFMFLSWVVYEVTLGLAGLDWSHGLKGVLEQFWYGRG